MFNLTVTTAHTFYVGTNGWLVHNAVPTVCDTYKAIMNGLAKYNDKFTPTSHILPNGQTTNPLIHILMGEGKAGTSAFSGGHHYDSLIGTPKMFESGNPAAGARQIIKDPMSPSGFTFIDASGTPTGYVPTTVASVAPNGVYNVPQYTVTLSSGSSLRKNTPSGSTFFPDSWSADKVIEELAGSLSGASLSTGGKYISTTPSGVKVEMYLDSHGRIYAAWPAWPQ